MYSCILSARSSCDILFFMFPLSCFLFPTTTIINATGTTHRSDIAIFQFINNNPIPAITTLSTEPISSGI